MAIDLDLDHVDSIMDLFLLSEGLPKGWVQGPTWRVNKENFSALNVSGFIAQLIERRTGIARPRVQAPLKS